jgi:thiamine-phosphate pyrophosphorylase
MLLSLQQPITYLITSGETTPATTPDSEAFARILKLVQSAVAANISLVQLREKNLTVRVLFALAEKAAAITRGSATKLLINDRADVARGAGADGVHLTARSIDSSIIRRTFGDDLTIGVSTHSFAEARRARDGGADFVVFGPIFETTSKQIYGAPVGVQALCEIVRELAPFPVIALGGVTLENAEACIETGASGVAGIGMFHDADDLSEVVRILGAITAPPAYQQK